MPHYDYECCECNYKFEAFHSMSAKPLIDCPECNKPTLIKLIGMGSAAIVRGTETPCRGNRDGTTKKKCDEPKKLDRLGEGKNKGEKPFWRDGPVNKEVLKNPKKYIKEGKID